MPIDFLDISLGHNFCPAKLFRDDQNFVLYMQQLFIVWQTGQTLSDDSFVTCKEETIQDLYDMIAIWNWTERESNYFKLSLMIGGDPDDKNDSTGSKK